LPYEKHVFKTCIIIYNEDKYLENIAISDSNSRLSTYWWEDFLELRELNSNEYNTKTAFEALDYVMSRKIKDKSPSDYTLLRNNLIGYFRTQPEFNYNTLVSSVFGEYQSELPALNIEELKQSISSLPERKKFDRVFTIVPKEIKAKIKRIYKITDNIELKVNGHIDTLKNTIQSVEDQTGEKFIKIKTNNDQVYQMFKYK